MSAQICRIAITGGPGAGKSTVVTALRQRFDSRVLFVPEVATMMFSGAFPPVRTPEERCAVQRAIFHVQRNLEDVWTARCDSGQVMICDRGTPDGAGYWPNGIDAFFAEFQTSHERELMRYDGVVFLESAAVGGLPFHEGNACRSEACHEAVAIDRRLHEVWSRHPNFIFIPWSSAFESKVEAGLQALQPWLA